MQGSSGFTMVENLLITCMELTIYEKMVYIVLSCYAERETRACYPSYNTIAEKAGCSRRKAIEVMNRLCELGLITKISKTPDGKNAHACNLYIVNSNIDNGQVESSSVKKLPENAASLPDIKRAFPNEYDALPHAHDSLPDAHDTHPHAHPAPKQYPLIKNQLNQNQSVNQEADRLTELLDGHFDFEYFAQQPNYYKGYQAMISYMVEMLTAESTKISGVSMSRDELSRLFFQASSEDLMDFMLDMQKKGTNIRIANPTAYMKTAWVQWIRSTAVYSDILYNF